MITTSFTSQHTYTQSSTQGSISLGNPGNGVSQAGGGHHHCTRGAGSGHSLRSGNSVENYQRNTAFESFDRGMKVFDKQVFTSVQSSTTANGVTTTFSSIQMSKYYTQMSEAAASVEEVPAISSETASNNILNFINQRLQQDVANGATPDELASRIDAGLQGFEVGFAQARKDLEDMGLLTPEIDAETTKTYDTVIAGIDKLREQYLPPVVTDDVSEPVEPAAEASDDVVAQSTPAAAEETAVTVETPVEDSPEVVQTTADQNQSVADDQMTRLFIQSRTSPVTQNTNSIYSLETEATQTAQSSGENSGDSISAGIKEVNRTRFLLTTQDGDKVEIRFRTKVEMNALISSGAADQGNMSEALLYDVSTDSFEKFSMTVDGELDDEELAAINDLLGQVGELSTAFYNGDTAQALQKASTLGYDFSEIKSFSLSLKQIQTQKMQTSYDMFQQPGAETASPLSPMADAMTQLSNRLTEMLGTVSNFPEPEALITDMSKLYDQPETTSFSDLVAQLLKLDTIVPPVTSTISFDQPETVSSADMLDQLLEEETETEDVTQPENVNATDDMVDQLLEA